MMLETSAKPVNIYYQQPESGYDSANQSAESSRRNSIGFKEYVKKRRFSIVGRFTSRPTTASGPEAEKRKTSDNSGSGDSPDEEDDLSPRPLFQRRMSVPEKVFLNADYAILKPTLEPDVRFEIVAAFDRHTDPYRHYMQSLTCYDLAPIHSAVVVMDGKMLIHKALTNLIQSGHHAAIICNADVKGGVSMLTFTDCIRAIVLAARGDQPVAEQTVAQFITQNSGKQLITAEATTSIWDAARMICLNSVHRIPVFQHDEFSVESKPGEVLYMLTLRTVFNETVMRLSDPKFSLGPHIKLRSLSEAKIGTWTNLYKVNEHSKCSEVIEIFLERRVSCVPVVSSKNNQVLGVVSKRDLMVELQQHPDNYLEIMDICVTEILTPRKVPFATPTMSLQEVIALLAATDRQAIFVLNVDGHLAGVVSYADLMDYIQNSSEIHHKMSCA